MLAFFRAFAKSWPAKLLLGILAVGFLFWGIQGALVPKLSTDVITAGQRSKSESQFRSMVDNQLNRLRQETGQAPTLQQLVKMGVPLQWANQIADQMALQAWIESAGIKPSKTLAMDAIKADPNFASAFNPITGKFDEKAFRALIAQSQVTESDFLESVRDDLASRQLARAVAGSTQAPKLYSAMLANYMLQTRDASFFILSAKALGALPVPTDADLKKLYDELGDQVRRSETRALTVVLFNPAKVAPTVKVDPAEEQKIFDFRKDSYSIPEKRTFVQISAKDAQSAAKIAQALRAGQTPDAAAKANGGQVTSQTDAAKSAVPDPKVGAAVFALTPGQVSDPVNGDLGWAVVKLQSVTPGRAATLAEKRPEIDAYLRERAAKDQVSDMMQKYTEARDKGLSAADAGAQVGAEVSELPPMTDQGQTYNGQQLNIPAQVLQRILQVGFSLPKGGKSDPQALQGGIYFAVGVKDVRPAYKPSLDEVRPDLVQAWTSRTVAARLQAKADELVADLKKGQPMAQAAASVGAQLQHGTDIKRAPPQSQNPSSMIISVLFEAKKGEPFAKPLTPAATLIGEVEAVHPPATVNAAQMVAARGATDASRLVAQDLLQSLEDAVRAEVKPKVNKKNLNSAMGVSDQQQ